MSIFNDVAHAMQSIFGEDIDQLAKETGFIKRERKVTGSRFVKTLLFAWMQNKTPSVEGLARAGFTHNLQISAQGLTKRFTPESSRFIRCVLEKALTKVVKSSAVNIEVLNRFSAVYVADCSKIALPNELKDTWQGTGGRGTMSKAGLKIDASIELKTGELQFGLLHGKHSDNKSPIAQQEYEKDVLHLRDLGYFKLSRMNAQNGRKEYWLSRFQPRTKLFDENGQAIDLLKYLKDESEHCNQFEMNVMVGAEEQVQARFVCCKLGEESANRPPHLALGVGYSRAKLNKNARKQGRKPSVESLALCNWNLSLT